MTVAPLLYSLAGEDGRQVGRQPLVAVRHRAVVHIVDQVGRDEGEGGQGIGRQVGSQLLV